MKCGFDLTGGHIESTSAACFEHSIAYDIFRLVYDAEFRRKMFLISSEDLLDGLASLASESQGYCRGR